MGKGPANHIDLQYWINSNEYHVKWTKPLLMPNESEEFFIQTEQNKTEFAMDFFTKNQTILNIKGECEDISGKKHTIHDSIDVTKYVAQFQQTKIRYQEDPLHKIAESLKKIENKLGNN